MKKLIYCALALAAGLFATSCMQENLEPVQGGNTVTFTVEIPEVATKAAAVGNEANKIDDLVYAVYRTSEDSVDEALKDWNANTTFLYAKNYDVNPFNNGSATISLELLNDQNHIVLLWAQHDNTWVTGEDATALTNISYPEPLRVNAGEADKYAAFSTVKFIAANNRANASPIVLTRPFAQINIATLDPTNYNVEIGSEGGTVITVNGAGSAFNVASQSPAGTADVTYSWTGKVSANTLTVNSQDYDHYLAMGYVFASDAVSVDYTITTTSGHGTITNSIPNVPVAKNYRTNIIGNLLTSDVKYNVTLDKDWSPAGNVDNDKVVSVWDGSSIAEPSENAGTYTISTAEELAWLAAAVNGTLPETKAAVAAQNFSGKTFKLMCDIDLNGFEWTPIGSKTTRFAGLFDGDNHTISNFYVNQEGYAGLFGNVYVGEVNNLTVKDVTIVANHYAGGIVGQGYVNMENCHVENINITLSTKNADWGDKAGGIVGQNCEGAEYIKNSSAKNVTIRGYRDLGGIAGMAHNSNIVSDCYVENITITQDLTVNYEDKTPTTVGAVVGRQGSNVTFENNTVGEGIVISKIANDDATFAELLKLGGNIVLKAGNYTFPTGNVYPGEVKVIAEEEAVVVITLPKSTYLLGTSLTLENIKFKVPSGLNYDESNFAFIHQANKFNMNNCLIDGGRLRLNVREANINKCQFKCDTQSGFDGYGLFYYGIDNSTVNVSNSTFTTLGKAIVLYNEGKPVLNLNVDGCTFTSSDNTTDKTAIQMHSEWGISGNVNIKNSTATGFANINGGLWYDVNNNTKEPNTNFNITVDGLGVVRVGYTQVANYPGLWTKDGEYFVYDLAGLKDLHKFFAANSIANSTWGKTYNIGADIDAEGYTWDGIWMNVGDNSNDGIVLDGNNHTISNLTINNYMFASTPAGGNEGVKPGEVKNITMKNPVVNGSSHDATVFWGYCYTNVDFTNVVVDGAVISGGSNVGALMSRTAIESANGKIALKFTDCKVINSTLKADDPNADPTGASAFIGRAYGNTTIKFSGCEVENNTIINENDLVGGEVYGYSVYVDGGWAGTGACDTFTDFAGVEAVKVGTAVYGNFADAIAAAKTGDTISLLSDVTLAAETKIPAGVTLKGNGKQINGSIYAGGDLTFEGHTKVTGFSASYYDRTIKIGEGACLEVTGTGRVTFGYGNTFDITGSIADAKNTDKTTVQPSMIIPGGISITGGSDFTMNLTNAYVQIGSISSKNNAANGTFTLNIENSIAEFTSQLTFAEPTDGKNPTFNLNIKNSLVTTPTKLCIAAPKSNVVIDNSTVTLGTYLRNSGVLTLKNGSELTGSTIQFGENGGNNGTIKVDNSKLTIAATSTGHAFDGQGTGSIILTNSAKASVTYYKAMTINVDDTSTFTGTEVK